MFRLGACLKILFAACVLVVVILNLLPGPSLPSVDVSDKLEHFIAYAILGSIGAVAFPTRRNVQILMAMLVALGVVLEFCQWFVPGRSTELGDAIASGLGACASVGLLFILRSKLAHAWRKSGAN